MSNIATINDHAERAMRAHSATPADLLNIAIEKGADLEKLEKLMELQDRWEAKQARNAYVGAMAEFKAEAPTISKDKLVSYASNTGKKTEYTHATLGNVVSTIVPLLAKHGLSHAWDTRRIEGGRVEVSCRITHRDGHCESITLDAPLDDSGGKNNIQSLGSAITYLQRYTLLAITGLATADMDDDDGHSYEQAPQTISGKQCATIRDWIASTGSSEAKFCAAYKIETIAQLRADPSKS